MAKSTTKGNGVKTGCLCLAGGILAIAVACAEGTHVSEHIAAEPKPTPVAAVASPNSDPLAVMLPPLGPAPPLAPSFELKEKERLILQQILADDFAAFSKGGNTVFGQSEAAKEYVVVSADELQTAYERNEVAGDMAYRGKRLALRGSVAEIKRSIGENYFLTLKGGTNQFMQPTAEMADGFIDYLAKLEKGQDIRIVCMGNGMLMGSAMATECIPADTWIEQAVSAKMLELSKLVGFDQNSLVMIPSVVVTEQLKQTSPCFSQETKLGDERCQKDISHAVQKLRAKNGKSGPKLSAATRDRFHAIPGAKAYLEKMAEKAQ